MATRRGPSIVRNGLIICLDAADRKSYPGSGTSWNNLGSQSTTGTLNNTPTWYPNEKGGSFYFDTFSTGSGDTEGVTFTNLPDVTTGLTMEMFVNLSNAAKNFTQYAGWLCGRESKYRIIYGNGALGFTCATVNNDWGNTRDVYVYPPTIGIWMHLTCLYDGTYNRIYINGELAGTSASTSGNISTTYNQAFYWFWTGAGILEGGRGYGSILRIYNRGLTATEVAQNFNANRRRFGL